MPRWQGPSHRAARRARDRSSDQARLNLTDVTLDAQDGSKLALDGAVDLSNAAINARMTLSEPPPPSALLSTPPELSVSIKGPFMAPQRTLDTTALTDLLPCAPPNCRAAASNRSRPADTTA